MAEEKGIKESLELFEGLKPIATFAGKTLEDGKVGVEDLAHLIDLAIDFQKVTEGFKGIDQISAEIKDLSRSELVQLIMAAYGVAEAFKEAKNPELPELPSEEEEF